MQHSVASIQILVKIYTYHALKKEADYHKIQNFFIKTSEIVFIS